MTLKKLIGKIHLYLGLTSGLVVFIVSITGCIYVFSEEIFNATHKDMLYVSDTEAKPLPLTTLWEKAQSALGEEADISSGIVYQDPERTWTFYTYKSNPDAVTYFGMVEQYKTTYLDPYTGEVKGVLNNKYEFFNLVKWLHWSLFLSTDYGQPIVGWSTFIFVCMLITGIVLWWPKNKSARKQRFSIKWKARWRRVNYDLHNVLGFYISVVVLIIAFTGMVWAFSWFKSTVYVLASGTTTPPAVENSTSTPAHKHTKTAPLDLALADVWAAYPNAYRISLSRPGDSTGVIRAYVQQLEGVYYKNASFQYDQYSGKRLTARHHRDKNMGEKLITANYDIHVGAILGLPGKILAFLASLISTSLPITGVMIWWGRRKKNKQKRGKNSFRDGKKLNSNSSAHSMIRNNQNVLENMKIKN